MYKRGIYAIILMFLPMILGGCTNRLASISSAILQKEVIPQGSGTIGIGYNTDGGTTSDTGNNEIGAEITAVLPAGYLILAYKWSNLDLDDLEESVVAFSSQDSNVVQLLIGHYNATTNNYDFVWQGVSSAIVNNEFTLTVEDITDNFRKEISVMGIDESGHQVIDIFSLPATGSYDLKDYTKLFSVSSIGGGDIELGAYERSNTYENGEAYGKSYSIIVYNIYQDENRIEKVYYKWSYSLSEYYQDSTEVFSQNDIAEQQLRSLYTSDDDVWKIFLDGVWVKKQSTTHDDDTDIIRIFIYFSSKVPNVNIVMGNAMLLYKWTSMIRTFSARGIGIRVRLQDLVLPQLKDMITIEVLSRDTLFVTFSDSTISGFSGVYVNANIEYGSDASYLQSFSHGMDKRMADFRKWLQGQIYVENTNEYYFFRSSTVHVVSEHDASERQLYYDIFHLGGDVFLELKEKNNSTAVFYRIENFDSYSKSDEQKVNLQPYIITASTSYKDINKDPLVFAKQAEQEVQ